MKDYSYITELVRQGHTMAGVLSELSKADFYIEGCSNRSVTVFTGCLPVTISWETCCCHGGRMWFNQADTGIHVELSSPEYDESLGICDPDTELAYYIANKMVETLKDFEKYVYVVTTIGEYSSGKERISYFKSLDDASYAVFQVDGHDVMSEYDEVEYRCPNPDIVYKTKFVKQDEKGDLWFKARKFSNYRSDPDEVDREYDIKFSVFRKNPKVK